MSNTGFSLCGVENTASCSLSYSLETEYLMEPEACIFFFPSGLMFSKLQILLSLLPKVGVTVVYGHTWFFGCILRLWP